MKVAVTGSSGLIGSALVQRLRAERHDVRRLVRRPAQSADEVSWDPNAGTVDLTALAGVEGVVHLAAAGVGDHRWTDSYRRQILESRVDGTRTVVRALEQLTPAPRVLVSASAVGYYGDRGEELLSEGSGPGTGFLSEVAQAWEQEADALTGGDTRVVTIRSGIVLSPHGGALGPLLRLIRLGLGGPLGSGRQWWSWITLEDEVRAIIFALTGELTGAVNLTAPQPLRQAELVSAIARVAHRPSVLPAPSFALRLALGDMADAMVLGSQRAVPAHLDQAGFEFRHDTIDSAAAWVLGSTSS